MIFEGIRPVDHLQHDPLAMKLPIANNEINRVLMKSGGSIDVMFYGCFTKLWLYVTIYLHPHMAS